MEQGSRLLIVGWTGLFLIPASVAQGALVGDAAHSLLGLALLVTVATLSFRRTASIGVMMAMVVAAGACAMTPAPESMIPGLYAGLVMLVVVTRLRREYALAAFLLWSALSAPLYLIAGGDPSLLVDYVVLNLLIGLSLSTLTAALIDRALAVDHIRSAAMGDELVHRVRVEEKHALDAVRRLLHDEVLSTLMRIAGTGRVERDVVAGTIAHIRRPLSISAPRIGASVEQVVAAVGEQQGIELPWVLESRDRPPSLTATEASTIERALGELVRNARRHGLDDPAVTGSFENGTFRVRVENHRSRDAERAIAFGWGWQNSVRTPMAALGGTGQMATEGDRVVAELSWPSHQMIDSRPGDDPRSAERPPLETAAEIRRFMAAVWPAMLAHTYLAIRHTPTDVAMLQFGVVAALWLITVMLYVWLTRHGSRGWFGFFLALPIGVAVATSLWISGPASLQGFESWVLGMASVPLCAIAFFSNVWRAPFLVLVMLAPPVIAIVASPEIGWGQASGALMVTFLPLIAAAVGAAVRWARSQAEQSEQEVRDRVGSTVVRWSEQRSDSGLLGHTRGVVLPFLERVQSAGHGIVSDADRRAAQILAQQVRDELNAPGLLDPALRRRLAIARGNGSTVILVPGRTPHGDMTAVLQRLLDRSLDVLGPGDRLVLTQGEDGTTASISLVAPSAAERLKCVADLVLGHDVDIATDVFGATLSLGGYRNQTMAQSTRYG